MPSKTGVRVILALGSVWLALGPVPVRAVPLLTNGGFDVDNTVAGPVSPPTGWTATGDTAADSSHPFSGMNEAFLGIGILSQSIATGAGNTYTLSFELAPGPTVLQDAAATMTVSFAGQTVGTIKGNTQRCCMDPVGGAAGGANVERSSLLWSLDAHFALQAEPAPPPPYPKAEAQGHELGCL